MKAQEVHEKVERTRMIEENIKVRREAWKGTQGRRGNEDSKDTNIVFVILYSCSELSIFKFDCFLWKKTWTKITSYLITNQTLGYFRDNMSSFSSTSSSHLLLNSREVRAKADLAKF